MSSVSSRPIRNSVRRVPMYPDPPVMTYFIAASLPARGRVGAVMTARTMTTGSSAVERRLEALREADPVVARDQVWAWFVEAGQRFREDRQGAGEELAALFRAGTPPRDIDGPT